VSNIKFELRVSRSAGHRAVLSSQWDCTRQAEDRAAQIPSGVCAIKHDSALIRVPIAPEFPVSVDAYRARIVRQKPRAYTRVSAPWRRYDSRLKAVSGSLIEHPLALRISIDFVTRSAHVWRARYSHVSARWGIEGLGAAAADSDIPSQMFHQEPESRPDGNDLPCQTWQIAATRELVATSTCENDAAAFGTEGRAAAMDCLTEA